MQYKEFLSIYGDIFFVLIFLFTAKCNVFNTVLTCDWEPAVRLYNFCQLGPLTTCLAQLYLFVRHSYSLKSIRKTSFHLKGNYSIISLVDNTPLKIKYSYLQYFFLQKLRTYVTLEKIPNNYIFLRTCSGYWKMQVLTREFFLYFDRSELKFVWQVIFWPRSKRRHDLKAKIPLSTWPAKTISNTGLWPPLIYIKHKKIDIYNTEKPKYL